MNDVVTQVVQKKVENDKTTIKITLLFKLTHIIIIFVETKLWHTNVGPLPKCDKAKVLSVR